MSDLTGLTPSQIEAELNEINSRADYRGHFTNAELKRYEDLLKEGQAKERLHAEAKLADMRKIGTKIRREAITKRLDGQSPRYKGTIVSRSNSGTQADRSEAIKERHAKLRRGK